MEFLGELGSSFLFYFVLFLVVAIVAFVIRAIRAKRKEKGFRGYLSEQFPSFAPDQPMLMAKSESKKAKPDICLVIDEESQQIIILRNVSGNEILHFEYWGKDLTAVNLTNQMISRGFAPKTWSYEECLELVFTDGKRYPFYLENISNRSGTDAGAEAVKEIFKPWYEKLNAFIS